MYACVNIIKQHNFFYLKRHQLIKKWVLEVTTRVSLFYAVLMDPNVPQANYYFFMHYTMDYVVA